VVTTHGHVYFCFRHRRKLRRQQPLALGALCSAPPSKLVERTPARLTFARDERTRRESYLGTAGWDL